MPWTNMATHNASLSMETFGHALSVEPIIWDCPPQIYMLNRPKEPSLQYLDRNIIDVIFHDPATIINWKDGTKTVVKTQNGEIFDKEKGFAMAIMKYLSENKGNFNSVVKKWCE